VATTLRSTAARDERERAVRSAPIPGYSGCVTDERRVFEYRLESLHGESDNELRDVTCERLGDDGWAAYAVSMTGSPFATFVYAAFVCQLAYLRMNAAERS